MKTFSTSHFKKGFTLIEVMIVVAVISALVGMMAAKFMQVKARARDAIRKSDLVKIQRAIFLYNDKYGRMPPNKNPGFSYPSTNSDFLSELVDEGYLTKPPKDPQQGQVANRSYYYYDYGAGNPRGALLVTVLETYRGTSGLPGSCRPFTGSNWCRSDALSSYFCLCMPY
jgi:prepilin-type N-terminal cleavage/methylation domain-containing protein